MTKNESLSLKGLCISIICLHNLFHLIPGCVPENEFTLSMYHVRKYLFMLIHDDYLASTLSFMGWYGVAFFIFSTGYGLRSKYGDSIDHAWKFLSSHFMKLFWLSMPTLLIFVIVTSFYNDYTLKSYLTYAFQETFLLNLFDYTALQPGIYWYFGITMELYVFFLIITRLRIQRYLGIMAAVMMLVLQYMVFNDIKLEWVRHNFFGWIPCFALGYYLGGGTLQRMRLPSWHVRLPLVVAVANLFIVSMLVKYAWVASGLLFIILLLLVRSWIDNPVLRFLGTISASIFAVSPIIRSVWLHFHFNDFCLGSNVLIACAFFIAVIVPSYLHNLLYRRRKSVKKP